MQSFNILLIVLKLLFTNMYCSQLVCENFNELINSKEVGEELHLDVTFFILTEINIEKKQIIYNHEYEAYDMKILFQYDDLGNINYCSFKSIIGEYEAEICITDFIGNLKEKKEQFDRLISKHVSCFLGDCMFHII